MSTIDDRAEQDSYYLRQPSATKPKDKPLSAYAKVDTEFYEMPYTNLYSPEFAELLKAGLLAGDPTVFYFLMGKAMQQKAWEGLPQFNQGEPKPARPLNNKALDQIDGAMANQLEQKIWEMQQLNPQYDHLMEPVKAKGIYMTPDSFADKPILAFTAEQPSIYQPAQSSIYQPEDTQYLMDDINRRKKLHDAQMAYNLQPTNYASHGCANCAYN